MLEDESAAFSCLGKFPYLDTTRMSWFELTLGNLGVVSFELHEGPVPPLDLTEENITSNDPYDGNTPWKVIVNPGSAGRRPFELGYETAGWGHAAGLLWKHGALIYVKCQPDHITQMTKKIWIRGCGWPGGTVAPAA